MDVRTFSVGGGGGVVEGGRGKGFVESCKGRKEEAMIAYVLKNHCTQKERKKIKLCPFDYIVCQGTFFNGHLCFFFSSNHSFNIYFDYTFLFRMM